MARVKICGISTPDAFAAAAAADWVGFVFVAASPRAVTPAQAARLSAQGPAGPGRVGLFVDPSDDEVAAALAQVQLAALQLYTTPDRTRALSDRFGIPVWQAWPVSSRDSLPRPSPGHAPGAYLLDAQAPPGTPTPGGNATPFDWTLLRDWDAPAPWLLAGGLTPDNVAQAIAVSGAPAVDVSSGVESTRGVKDPALIHAFLAAARATPACPGGAFVH